MERHRISIKSSATPFSVETTSTDLIIEGVALMWDEIVAYTSHSSAFSDNLCNAEARWLDIETVSKCIRVEQGSFSILFRSRKDKGEALICAIMEQVADLVLPHLVLNTLDLLSGGKTLEIMPFTLTCEGIAFNTLFPQKFYSWDWDVRSDMNVQGLGFWSAATGYNAWLTVSYRCPHTGVRKEIGRIKGGAKNADLLAFLCLLLGTSKDEHLFPVIPKLVAFLRMRQDRFSRVPMSSLRRRLEARLSLPLQ